MTHVSSRMLRAITRVRLAPASLIVAAGILAGCTAVPLESSPTVALGQVQTKVYEADQSDFPNPERGFSRPWRGGPILVRAENMSLAHLYFRMDDYRAKPLSEAFLKSVSDAFLSVREGGVKAVPRFTYSFPKGEEYVNTDAPLNIALGHIEQLKPILRDNSDVIAFLEAGFVGAWGEWHHSTSGLEELPAKSAILNALLVALPGNRAIVLRKQSDKIAIFSRATPLSLLEAFTTTPVARVGHHNDCFLASIDNWGTYELNGKRSLEEQKQYLRDENRFLPQGGETCNEAADAQPYIQCPNALAELQAMRWSQLNRSYHPGVLNLWQKQGCLPEIARRLGYRLRLERAALPLAVRQGASLNGSIELVNDGFAGPYNARPVELVLRHRDTKREIALPVDADPRRWAGGERHAVAIDVTLPAQLEAGRYELFLNLPDESPRLRQRPEYSIRLANLQSWEPKTGYNALGIEVSIMSAAGAQR